MNCGETFFQFRISKPAEGKAARAAAAMEFDLLAVRQRQAIDPFDERAWLQQAGCAKSRLRHQDARAEAYGAGKLVGLRGENRTQRKCLEADLEMIARVKIEPVGKRQFGGDPIDPVMLGKHLLEILRQRELDNAMNRIGGIDRLDFDERGRPVGAPRHGTHQRDFRKLAMRGKKIPLVRVRLALHEFEGEIAAQDDAALLHEAFGQRARNRTDAGDGRQSKCQAGDENPKSGKAAAEIAQRHPQSERQSSQAA